MTGPGERRAVASGGGGSCAQKLRVSLGTAAVLGLETARLDVAPTTAYLLTTGGCLSTCAFCPQARSSSSPRDLLSRVTWPEFELDRVLAALAAAHGPSQAAHSPGPWRAGQGLGGGDGLQRVCVQVTRRPEVRSALPGIVSRLAGIRRTATAKFGISVSCHPSSLAEVEEVLLQGADRVGIPLDAATAGVYARVKAGSWEAAMNLLEGAAARFPGKISSHVIIGLGETERDAVEVIQRLTDLGITVGLFAFTPVRGTRMQNVPQPALESYRRIQLARHVIANGLARAEGFDYDGGRIRGFGLGRDEVLGIASAGEPFQTSGCPGCNRPYYNERPGGVMYNYPRPLSVPEARLAVAEAGLPGDPGG